MSKLDKMITKLCPDGVEYKTISELFNTRNGYTPSKAKKEYWINGTIPWFRMEDIRENGRILSKATQYVSESAVKGSPFPANSIIVATSATIGEHALIKVPSLANQRFTYLMLKDEYKAYIDIMFIYYYCFKLDEYCKACLNHGNFASVDMRKFAKFKFPVPPLEVQREIVRVLDSFTLLIAELTAELTARKKQYDFYRDALIQKECKIEKVKLNSVCEIYDGTHKTPKYTNTGIPFVSVENIDDLYGTRKFIAPEDYAKYKIKPRKGDVFMTRITAGVIGKCTVVDRDDDLAYYVSLALLRPNTDILDSKYLKYYLESGWGRKELSKWILWDATPTKINKDDIGRVLISIPPLDIQKRLVQVIEHFDAICTDLNIGLPAEIEARQKQYEYYRDLLLTFAETGSTLVTDRQTELNAIRLIQYVFGYAVLPLRKVANVFRGEYITKKNTAKGDIPVILGGQEPAYYINRYNHDGEIVVIARSGVSAGFVSYWNRKIYVTDGFGYEGRSELVITKYLYYVLKNMETALNAMKRGAGVPHVSGEALSNVMLHIPALQEQQRVVNILDRFDTLCNDLSKGLPAEIEARRKQYEYYRDKLLSFEEIQKK